MKPHIAAVLFTTLLATDSSAQQALPFHTKSIHVIRLNDGCPIAKAVITTDPRGDQKDWAATAAFAAQAVATLNIFGDIDIDLRRDDISDKPRAESGLALVSISRKTRDCTTRSDKVGYSYAAGRILSERELAIRAIHNELSNINADTADQKTRKLFNLPKGWRVPDADMAAIPWTEPAPPIGPNQTRDANHLTGRILEKMKGGLGR